MSVENTRKSILSIAKVYLGYKEGYNNDNIFGDWYGMPNQPWCAMFVSFCMYKAGVSQDVVQRFASCTVGWNWFRGKGRTKDRSYTPTIGDIIFFDWGADGGLNHVGLVDRVENGRVYTVEGNKNDHVTQYSYDVNDPEIYGYVVPAYTGNETIQETNTVTTPSTNYPTIGRGSTGIYVKEAQNKLIAKGYSLSKYGADGIFGAETERVVRDFQADNGIANDGIIGPITWGKLNNDSTIMPSTYPGSVIGMGARGENVVKIQNELIRRGYEVSGGADGAFGSGCRNAVMQFQTDNGLTADGMVGKQTWDKLFPQSGVISSYPGYVLQMGARGEEVVAVQEKLISLGYTVSGGADGAFGSGTRDAVRLFQASKGIKVDGSVGKETWDALFPTQTVVTSYPGYLIAEGMSDYNVTLIQTQLSKLGHRVGAIDGIFGSSTKAAVIQFQLINRLASDGIVGPATWNKLFNINVEDTPTQESNESVFALLRKLYSYAGQYKNSSSILERNLMVLQYLRRLEYGGKEWSFVAEGIDQSWIDFVNRTNGSALDIGVLIHLKNNETMSLPHLAITLETNLTRNLNSAITRTACQSIMDLAGWAGDLIQFANLFYEAKKNNGVLNWNATTISTFLFAKTEPFYGFSLEDLYQDIDACNLAQMLQFMNIEAAFKQYYETYKASMVNRRVSIFISSRIVNGILSEEIANITSNEKKLSMLAKSYLSDNFDSLQGILGTAFQVVLSRTFNHNLAPALADAFAGRIMGNVYAE